MNAIPKIETTGPVPPVVNTPPRRILVAVDFTPASRRAAEYAVQLAKDLGAKVTLLHICQEPVFSGYSPIDDEIHKDVTPAYRQRAADQLSSELGAMRQIYPEVGSTVRTSTDPCTEILKAARELAADLLVTAACGYSDLKHPSYGRKETNLIFYARCPVLVVH
jgi:nucleotide-binding universal stress UspA family protein